MQKIGNFKNLKGKKLNHGIKIIKSGDRIKITRVLDNKIWGLNLGASKK